VLVAQLVFLFQVVGCHALLSLQTTSDSSAPDAPSGDAGVLDAAWIEDAPAPVADGAFDVVTPAEAAVLDRGVLLDKAPVADKALVPDKAPTVDQAIPDQAIPDQAVPDQEVPDQAIPDQTVDKMLYQDKGAVTCNSLENEYALALQQAKKCTSTSQCTKLVDHQLACPCPTFVNPNNTQALGEMANLQTMWLSMKCYKNIFCPAVMCPVPVGAKCANNACWDVTNTI
jgi:hypothetical protein